MSILDIIKSGYLILIKSLIALILIVLNIFFQEITKDGKLITWIIFFLMVVDIFIELKGKLDSKKKEERLKKEYEQKSKQTIESFESINEKLEEQKEFNSEYKEEAERSLKVLNRFISKSLLNEKDILKLAKSGQYYVLYVYSWPFPKFGINKEDYYKFKRLYPVFLEKLGFIRMGRSSPLFIMNKNKLKEKKFHEISEFKEFLNMNLQLIRKQEFRLHLNEVKQLDNELYSKYLKDNPDKYLKINFLLLENIIHSGNLGFVNGDPIGLNSEKERGDLVKEILGSIQLKDIHLDKNIKINIKKYFKNQDFDILLPDVDNKTINLISGKRNKIKEEIGISHVMEISQKNLEDIELVLSNIKVKDFKEIASKMKEEATAYREAFDGLGISMD